jgi:hypothetical protein
VPGARGDRGNDARAEGARQAHPGTFYRGFMLKKMAFLIGKMGVLSVFELKMGVLMVKMGVLSVFL